MTEVAVLLSTGKYILGIKVSGHAGYGVIRGADIVCSSCSTLMTVLDEGIRGTLKIPCATRTDEKNGIWEIMWADRYGPAATPVAKTVAAIFRRVSEKYPANVSYEEVEV